MEDHDEKKDDITSKLLCNGCLCIGRTLHKITEEKLARFYVEALREIPAQTSGIPLSCPTMCWECKASLKKAAAFKEQVQDSHRILLAYTNESLRECLVSDIVRSSRLRPQIISVVSIDPESQTEMPICSPARDRLDTQQCVFFKEEFKNESIGAGDDEPMALDDGPSDIDNQAQDTEVVYSKKKKKKKKNKLDGKVKRTEKVVKRLQRGAKMPTKPKNSEDESDIITTEDPLRIEIQVKCETDNSCNSNDYIDSLHRKDSDMYDEYGDDLPSQLVEISHDIDSTGDGIPCMHDGEYFETDGDVYDDENDWEDTTDEIPQFSFEKSEGPTFEINENTTAADVFKEMVNEQLINYLVDCTNANGTGLSNQEQKAKSKYSRLAKFKETDSEEMKLFLALTFLHGHIKIPAPRKLFAYDDTLYYHPIFTRAMSGRRYEQLVKCFSASEFGCTGKEKVKHFVDTLIQVFQAKYQPGRDLSIEECLVLVNGRLLVRNTVDPEIAKSGIKFYTLTDSDGYVLNLETYLGVDDVSDLNGENCVKVDRLVLNLMNPYLNKGHNVHMGSLYNSVRLSQRLLDLRTHSSGVLRYNQDIPKTLQNRVLSECEHVWVRKRKVYVSKWQNKRPVYAVTTKDYPQLIQLRSRIYGKMLKPKEIVNNTSNLRCSRIDQLIDHHSCPRKLIMWEKKILFYILDLCLWNSFVLFKKYAKNGSKYDYVMFREDIIKEFLQLENLKETEIDKRSKHHSRRFKPDITGSTLKTHSHWPVKTDVQNPDPKKKKAPYLKCKMCYKNKLRRETCFRCQGCPSNPPLCPGCFQEWHERVAPIN